MLPHARAVASEQRNPIEGRVNIWRVSRYDQGAPVFLQVLKVLLVGCHCEVMYSTSATQKRIGSEAIVCAKHQASCEVKIGI